MTAQDAKKQAVRAIQEIVKAAKQLAEAERRLSKEREPPKRKQTTAVNATDCEGAFR